MFFEQKYEKYQNFLSENFKFLEVKFSIYLNRRVFVMEYATYYKKAATQEPCYNCHSEIPSMGSSKI